MKHTDAFRFKQRVITYLAMSMTLLLLLPNNSIAITLHDCIEAALDKSPDIEAASCRIDAARSKMKKAASSYYPWVTLSSAYTRTNNPTRAFMMELNQRNLNMRSPEFDPNNPDDTDNIRTSFEFKYRLLDFGGRRMDYMMAKQGKSAAFEQLQAIQNQLIHEVTRYYYGALQARTFVSVQEKAVESIQESLRVARARYDAGTAVKTDVLNLEVQLAKAQEDLIKARNGINLAIAALNTAIGKDFIEEKEIDHGGIDTGIPDLMSYEQGDVESRPEMKLARLMADIKENAVTKARQEYAPTVNAFGSIDWDGKNYSDTKDSYFVGANIKWNAFTGFYNASGLSEAQADRKAAQAELEKIRNQLLLDLKQSYLKAMEARERLAVARKSVKSAEEALRITGERYKHKAADITELLTAEVGLTSIRTRAATAYYDYLIALSNMDRAKGSLVKQYANSSR